MSKIKKLLAAIMAVLMLVSLVACGEGNGPANSTTAPKATDKATESPAATDPAPDETTAPAANLTVHENTFFTVGYNEEDGWTLAEDDIEAYEGGGYAYLRILNEDGYTGLLVYMEAYEESASSFRETLHTNGVDMKAYVEYMYEGLRHSVDSSYVMDYSRVHHYKDRSIELSPGRENA